MSTVSLHALSAGHITIPERFFVVPADQEAKKTVPSLSFLIQHKDDNGRITRIVFDLGMRRNLDLYPKVLAEHLKNRQPVSTNPDAVASLAKGGLGVDDIDYVIFSHVHYDHVGLPRDFTNSKTKFVVGNGALDLLSGKTKLKTGKHMVFESDLLPLDRTIELPSPNGQHDGHQASNLTNHEWVSIGIFPNAVDFFNDGTVYIVDAPGHLPGHINLLCRISTKPTKFVSLAGDSCHDVRLLSGERDIATWTDEEGNHCCMHIDISKSKETLSQLYTASKEGIEVDGQKVEVEVVFAHDYAWEKANAESFWPGKLA
jgi:glyoxylase-like metal-dependent hydrolase (beta-lactamase superfamily II)